MNPKRSDRPNQDNSAPSDAPPLPFGVIGGGDPSPTESPTPAPEPAGASEPPPTGPPVTSATSQPPNPFDINRLRLSQRGAASLGVRKPLVTVPVRKPLGEWFVRSHPAEEYRLPTAVVELKDDRETYLVEPELWDLLAEERTFSPRLLALAVTRAATPFVWPVRLPGPDGKLDSWSESALDAVRRAETAWVRVSANMQLQAYDIVEALSIPDEPIWPKESMGEILQVAFRGRVIDSIDHPVLRRLRGEV